MTKALSESREKTVYLARDYTTGIGDLVTGMGIKLSQFLDVAHWASKRQIEIGVRGFDTGGTYTTLNRYLKTRERNGKLRVASVRYSKHATVKAYALPRKTRNFDPENYEDLYHGYSTTECLIRFLTAKYGEAIPERMFKGYGRVPEFGVRYERSLLLCEFSTEHDTNYSGKLRGKLNGYDDCLPKIEHEFDSRCVVVFVLDVSRDRVRRLVERHDVSEAYYFTDFQTFKEVPLGRALIEPKYIWRDGSEVSLTE